MKYKLNKSELDLNLAPMIDVVFLLLIFFIVASTLNIREVKTTINLPDTEAVEKRRETEIAIVITEEGKIYLGEKEVSLNNLRNFLEERLKHSSKRDVSIYADKKVAFQQVVRVMDVVKKLKVDNLSFALRNKSHS
ncbi:MAG: biopolymer transport protein ExbD [Halanaerobiales bacterium]|nr:biopolymer transport protein ExbD [Halanaerobiales bacterium]